MIKWSHFKNIRLNKYWSTLKQLTRCFLSTIFRCQSKCFRHQRRDERRRCTSHASQKNSPPHLWFSESLFSYFGINFPRCFTRLVIERHRVFTANFTGGRDRPNQLENPSSIFTSSLHSTSSSSSLLLLFFPIFSPSLFHFSISLCEYLTLILYIWRWTFFFFYI